MAKQNKSIYVVLGILSIKPLSGYDIKAWIEGGVGFFWNINYNQIYPALKSFLKDGLATCTVDKRESRPERKVYSLTAKGLETLRQWLVEPIDFNSSNGNELLLKLFFGAQIPVEDNIAHLTRYHKHASQVLANLLQIGKTIDQETFPDPSRPYRKATLTNGIMTVQTYLDWCEKTIGDLKSGNDQSDT